MNFDGYEIKIQITFFKEIIFAFHLIILKAMYTKDVKELFIPKCLFFRHVHIRSALLHQGRRIRSTLLHTFTSLKVVGCHQLCWMIVRVGGKSLKPTRTLENRSFTTSTRKETSVKLCPKKGFHTRHKYSDFAGSTSDVSHTLLRGRSALRSSCVGYIYIGGSI